MIHKQFLIIKSLPTYTFHFISITANFKGVIYYVSLKILNYLNIKN